MAVTGRLPLLVGLGAVAVVLDPTRRTVLLWLLVCLGLVLLDLALALPPGRLVLERSPIAPIRLGESTVSQVLVTNPTGRTLRGALRDAWQPSAGPAGDRHTVRMEKPAP